MMGILCQLGPGQEGEEIVYVEAWPCEMVLCVLYEVQITYNTRRVEMKQTSLQMEASLGTARNRLS